LDVGGLVRYCQLPRGVASACVAMPRFAHLAGIASRWLTAIVAGCAGPTATLRSG